MSRLAKYLVAACCALSGVAWGIGPVVDYIADSGFESEFPVLYPDDSIHSPLTDDIVAGLLKFSDAAGVIQNDVFAKTGDQKLVSSRALHCFAGAAVDFGSHSALQATLNHFLAGDAGGDDPFSRSSLATGVGRNTGWLLSGEPPPLVQEIEVLWPRVTLMAFGENDMAIPDNVDGFANNLLDAIDYLRRHGSVPLIYSPVPCQACPGGADSVALYRLMARTVAQYRQVPFLDLFLALDPLPDDGLAGDGVNLNAYFDGTTQACVLTSAGLDFGYNMFNLVTLQALDRLRRTVIVSEPAPDTGAARRAGTGDAADPVLVESFPFGDGQNLTLSGPDEVDSFSGCAQPEDTSGPEVIYRLDIATAGALHAELASIDGADLDLWLFEGGLGGADCVVKVDQTLQRELTPGTWYLVVEAFESGGVPMVGEYLLTADFE